MLIKLSVKCNTLLKNSRDEKVKNLFNDSKIITAFRQPKNILRLLTKAEFTSNENSQEKKAGFYKCTDKKCLLGKFYIQECTSFATSNGVLWTINCDITCNSKNVIYFLKCSCCNIVTYTGKTNNLRK